MKSNYGRNLPDVIIYLPARSKMRSPVSTEQLNAILGQLRDGGGVRAKLTVFINLSGSWSTTHLIPLPVFEAINRLQLKAHIRIVSRTDQLNVQEVMKSIARDFKHRDASVFVVD